MTTGQTWDPERYARPARFVSDLGLPVVELLDPQPGERILDLGCGDGALTEKLSVLGATVVAVDASPEQVAAARARGLDARVADGEALPFRSAFVEEVREELRPHLPDTNGVWTTDYVRLRFAAVKS